MLITRSPHFAFKSLVFLLFGFAALVGSNAQADTLYPEVHTITDGTSLAISCDNAWKALKQSSDADSSSDPSPGTTLSSLPDSPPNDAFLCMAFLSGVMEASQHANKQAKLRYSLATDGKGDQAAFNVYCFNWQLSYKNIIGIVLSYANNNPAYLRGQAHVLVIKALQTAFPCR